MKIEKEYTLKLNEQEGQLLRFILDDYFKLQEETNKGEQGITSELAARLRRYLTNEAFAHVKDGT